MKSSASRSLLAAALLSVSVGSFAQSFEDGMGAYFTNRVEDAIAIWKPLAQGGDLRAQVKLGDLYMEGKGSIAANLTESAKWYLLAANQNDVTSQWTLGAVLSDPIEKCAWLEIADANGHRDAKLIMPTLSAADLPKCKARSAELRAKIKKG